jgi:hypothetical protein
MKNWKRYAILISLLALPMLARGDILPPGATLVAQSSTRNDAAICLNAQGTTQQTITIPICPGGQYAYITGIWSDVATSAAPTAGLATTTTTNLNGLALQSAVTATAGIIANNSRIPATPIKAVSNALATTIVSNAAIASVSFNLSACYYCAP